MKLNKLLFSSALLLVLVVSKGHSAAEFQAERARLMRARLGIPAAAPAEPAPAAAPVAARTATGVEPDAPRVSAGPDDSFRTKYNSLIEVFQAEKSRYFLDSKNKESEILRQRDLIRSEAQRFQSASEQLEQKVQATERDSATQAQKLLAKTEEQIRLLEKIEEQNLFVQRAQERIDAVGVEKDQALQEARQAQQRIAAVEVEKERALVEAGLQAQALATERDRVLAQVAAVERARAEIEHRATEVTQRVAALGAELHQKGAALQKAEGARDTLQVQIQGLSERAERGDTVAEELASLQTKHAQSLRSIEQQEKQIEFLNQEKSSLTEDLAHLKAATLEASQKLAELEELRKAHEGLKAKTVEQEVALKRLSDEISSGIQEKRKLLSQIDMLEEALKKAACDGSASEASSRQRTGELEKQLRDAQKELDDKENTLESLRKELSQYTEYLEAMSGIQGYAAASFETAQEYLRQIKELEEELERNRLEIGRLKKSKETLEGQLLEQGLELAGERERLASQMSQGDADQVASLQAELDKKEQKISKITEENVAISKRHKKVTESKLKLEQKVRERESELAHYKQSIGLISDGDISLDASLHSTSFQGPGHSPGPATGKKLRRGKGNPSVWEEFIADLQKKLVDVQGANRLLLEENARLEKKPRAQSQRRETTSSDLLEIQRQLDKEIEEKQRVVREYTNERDAKARLLAQHDLNEELVKSLNAQIDELRRHLVHQEKIETFDETMGGAAATTFFYSPSPAALKESAAVRELRELQENFARQALMLAEATASNAQKDAELRELREKRSGALAFDRSSGDAREKSFVQRASEEEDHLNQSMQEIVDKSRTYERQIGSFLEETRNSVNATLSVTGDPQTPLMQETQNRTRILPEKRMTDLLPVLNFDLREEGAGDSRSSILTPSSVPTPPFSSSDEEAVQGKNLFQEDFLAPFAPQPRVLRSPQGGRPVDASTPDPAKKEKESYGKGAYIFS
jgi:hypothetical protein